MEGLLVINVGICDYDTTAARLLEISCLAEELGFESVWLGEHLVLPVGYESAHPTTGSVQHHSGPIVSPDTHLLDPWAMLGGIATRTERLLLATGIYIVPLRHPLLTARAAATVAELSRGRLRLGIGAGWLREEFDAFGIPFEERFSRTVETLAVLRAAWAGGPIHHQGEHFQIDGVQVCESAVSVPLVLGGNSPPALRRAAQLGDGWMSSGTPSLEEAIRLRDQLVSLRDASGRGGDFPLYFRIPRHDPRLIETYEREGFTHVLFWADQIPKGSGESLRPEMSAIADRLGLRAPARSAPS
jgi:probable F420-dependent oxidoreductase